MKFIIRAHMDRVQIQIEYRINWISVSAFRIRIRIQIQIQIQKCPKKRAEKGTVMLNRAGVFNSASSAAPSDSSVPTDAGIVPRTVATGALAVRCSNH
jgi:hypothetical protein